MDIRNWIISKRAHSVVLCKAVGISELVESFPNDDKAEEWLSGVRWPDGVCCWQRHGFFSIKKGTVMQSSKTNVVHMTHCILKVLEQGEPELLGGIVELDKTFVGDKERNQHEHHQDRDTEDKAAAAEAVQRDTYGHNRGSTARQGCSSSFEQAVVSPSLLCLNF